MAKAKPKLAIGDRLQCNFGMGDEWWLPGCVIDMGGGASPLFYSEEAEHHRLGHGGNVVRAREYTCGHWFLHPGAFGIDWKLSPSRNGGQNSV